MAKVRYTEDMKLVENYIESHEYDSAIKELELLLSKNGEKAEYVYLKAYCFFQLNRFEEATKETKNAILKGYSSDDCMNILDDIFNKMGETREAQEYFIRELIFYPAYEDEFLRIANIKFFMETTDNGRKFIKRAIKISPTNPEILRYAFDYYGDKGLERELKKNLEKYLECNLSEVEKLEINGDYEVYLKNYKNAFQCFQKANSIDPTNVLMQEKMEKAKKNSGVAAKGRNILFKILQVAAIIISIIVYIFLSMVTHSIIISGLVAFALCSLVLLILMNFNKSE